MHGQVGSGEEARRAVAGDVAIRPADAADAVARLMQQLGYAATAAQCRARIQCLARRGEHRILVVEAEGGAVVGAIHGFLRESLTSDTEAEIGALVVDEACRGIGLGRALVRAIEAWVGAAGCTLLRVRTNVVREEAAMFYASSGFELLKSQSVLRKVI